MLRNEEGHSKHRLSDMEVKERRRLMKKARKHSMGLDEEPSEEPWDINTFDCALDTDSSHTHDSTDRRHPTAHHGVQRVRSRRKPVPSQLVLSSLDSKPVRSTTSAMPTPDPEHETTTTLRVGKQSRANRPTSLFPLRQNDTDERYPSPNAVAGERSGETAVQTSASGVKRSRSLWKDNSGGSPRGGVSRESAEEFRRRYNDNFGSGRTISEKERLRNLKRARKITQMFGHEPPLELIQVPPQELQQREPRRRRDSTSTLFSLSSAQLLNAFSTPVADHDADDDEEGAPPLPSTPPPFANIRALNEDNSPPSTNVAFSERRRRAAKLSKFFGVGFNDITAPLEESQRIGLMKVDVRVAGRPHFWSSGDQKEVEVVDVIDRLRDLRAA